MCTHTDKLYFIPVVRVNVFCLNAFLQEQMCDNALGYV